MGQWRITATSIKLLEGTAAGDERSASAITAADGTFELAGLAVGARYALLVDSEDWHSTQPPRGSSRGLVIASASDVALVLASRRWVRLRLVNAATQGEVPVAIRLCDVLDSARRLGQPGSLGGTADSHRVPGLGRDLLLAVRGMGDVRVTASAHGFQASTALVRSRIWREVLSEVGDRRGPRPGPTTRRRSAGRGSRR